MKQVVRVLRVNSLLVTALVAIALVCLVHPALGLFVLLLSHALSCHSMLCRYASGLNSILGCSYSFMHVEISLQAVHLGFAEQYAMCFFFEVMYFVKDMVKCLFDGQ